MLAGRRSLRLHFVLFAVVLVIFFYCSHINFINLSRNHLSESPNDALLKLYSNSSKKIGATKPPDVIIVGAKKAGTRALVVYLNLHPKVKSILRELHFFSSQYHKGINWYKSQLPEVNSGELLVEKCPDYLVHPDAPRRVFENIPQAKIIIIVRDPVERAISDYLQLEDVFLQKGGTPGFFPKFEQFAFKDADFREVNKTWRPIQVGEYARHLLEWSRFFTQVHLVSGEALTSDPTPVMADVQTFLGLEHLVTRDNFQFNKHKGFWCYRSSRAAPATCLGKSKGRPHPRVHPHALEALRRYFRPWNERLYEMTGRNFNWTKPSGKK